MVSYNNEVQKQSVVSESNNGSSSLVQEKIGTQNKKVDDKKDNVEKLSSRKEGTTLSGNVARFLSVSLAFMIGTPLVGAIVLTLALADYESKGKFSEAGKNLISGTGNIVKSLLKGIFKMTELASEKFLLQKKEVNTNSPKDLNQELQVGKPPAADNIASQDLNQKLLGKIGKTMISEGFKIDDTQVNKRKVNNMVNIQGHPSSRNNGRGI
ncbi:hypothetical protein [Wolbachia endosymbiont of Pentidionis agamae]|uniref:hypothetical protein n=1 Tax=Wolbachia endosymbiont of Pentidionis agamae TaxID=3110435 RepID=UPI002FD16B20